MCAWVCAYACVCVRVHVCVCVSDEYMAMSVWWRECMTCHSIVWHVIGVHHMSLYDMHHMSHLRGVTRHMSLRVTREISLRVVAASRYPYRSWENLDLRSRRYIYWWMTDTWMTATWMTDTSVALPIDTLHVLVNGGIDRHSDTGTDTSSAHSLIHLSLCLQYRFACHIMA